MDLTMSMFATQADYWKARATLAETVVADVARELGCENDNEAILMAIDARDRGGAGMSQYHKWPGAWIRTAPRVGDHPEATELVWVVRGHPFTRAVVARTNVMVFYPGHDGMVTRAVRVELMADGLHGVDASSYPWFHRLEWRGPMAVPRGDE